MIPKHWTIPGTTCTISGSQLPYFICLLLVMLQKDTPWEPFMLLISCFYDNCNFITNMLFIGTYWSILTFHSLFYMLSQCGLSLFSINEHDNDEINCLNNVSLDPLQYGFGMEEGNLDAELFHSPLFDHMATNCNEVCYFTMPLQRGELTYPVLHFASASQMSIFLVRTRMEFMNSRRIEIHRNIN